MSAQKHELAKVSESACVTCGWIIYEGQCGCELTDNGDYACVNCEDSPAGYDYCEGDYDYYDYDDYDGQPDEFTEWQDLYGGDVAEYGTYGDYPEGDECW